MCVRLWHETLLPYLPYRQLLGQHRECCALRGNGWGKSHATVNYVFEHPYEWLWVYHMKVMREMLNRGFNVDPQWLTMGYQGKSKPQRVYYMPTHAPDASRVELHPVPDTAVLNQKLMVHNLVYPEHNDEYLRECVQNLLGKGIDLTEAFGV